MSVINENDYFEQMVDKIYSKELQLNETNTFDTKAPFLGLIYQYLQTSRIY